MNLLEPQRVARMEKHLACCDACKKRFAHARRNHASLLRTYEAFDQDHDELREKLLASLPGETPQPSRSGAFRRVRRLGEKMMTNPKVRFATATLSVAACLTVAFVMVGGSSRSMALDRIGEAIQQTRSMTAHVSLNITGGSTATSMTGKMYLSSEFGSRTDIYSGEELFMTTIQPIDGPAVSGRPGGPASFRITRQDASAQDTPLLSPDDFIAKLQDLTGTAKTELGPSVIEDRDVLGFEIDGDPFALSVARAGGTGEDTAPTVELWVDRETFLPVRYTISMPGMEKGSTMTVVCDRFHWNVDLDASLFDTSTFDTETAPKFDLKIPSATEDSLIAGLRLYSEIVEGEYPIALDFTKIMKDFYQRASVTDGRTPKKIKGPSDPRQMMGKLLPLYAGTIFFRKMVTSGVPAEYFGPDVAPGDANAVLVRWQLDDGRWRVIYGDLRAETLPARDQ